ncbi:hypothetical protein Syun_016823 [Stephania yunnanensis]|uniref:6-phosphogluconate dehydrogenase NADP-binding domain-containing protein n=1 Tax=Stephania yunnanensis TaxID=152371 RepID=A0AAP0J844_9MAGN
MEVVVHVSRQQGPRLSNVWSVLKGKQWKGKDVVEEETSRDHGFMTYYSTCSYLIHAGYSLTIFTRTQSKAHPLIDLGHHFAPSSAALTAQFDVVFAIIACPSRVRSVHFHLHGHPLHLSPQNKEQRTSDDMIDFNKDLN